MTPKKHFMPAGNATFERRAIPTKQDFQWYLTETYTSSDELAPAFERAKVKGHQRRTIEFGKWLYLRQNKEFQARYNAMLKGGPELWSAIRKVIATMHVESIGGEG